MTHSSVPVPGPDTSSQGVPPRETQRVSGGDESGHDPSPRDSLCGRFSGLRGFSQPPPMRLERDADGWGLRRFRGHLKPQPPGCATLWARRADFVGVEVVTCGLRRRRRLNSYRHSCEGFAPGSLAGCVPVDRPPNGDPPMTEPLSLAELRALADDDDTKNPGERDYALKAEWNTRREAMRDILNGAGDRGLRADEQRRFDDHQMAVNVIQVALSKPSPGMQRIEDSAAVRRANPGLFGTGGSQWQQEDREGAQLRAFLSGEGPNRMTIPIQAAMKERELQRKGMDPHQVRNVLTGDTGSGTLVVPTLVARSIFETLEAEIAAFRLPTTRLNTPTGADILVPTLATHGIGTQVSAEGVAIGGTDPVIGSKTLDAFKYGQLIQLSSEIITDSSIDILGMVANNAARALGRVIDTALVVGSGSGEPEGVMTAITGAGTIHGSVAGITYEQLVDLQYSVNSGYRSTGSAAWLMFDLTAGTLRKLRDGAGGTVGSPLWKSSESTGGMANYAPPTLLGDPAFTDPNVASVASTKKVIAYGDWSSYYLRTVGDLVFERDDSFAFDQDLSTFRAKWRVDGKVMDTAAFNVLRTV